MEDNIDKKKSKEEIIEVDTDDVLTPKVMGETYDNFIKQKHMRGSGSYLAHMLMSNFDDEKKKEAEDLIVRTLTPGDWISHALKQAKADPEVAAAFRKEIARRLGEK